MINPNELKAGDKLEGYKSLTGLWETFIVTEMQIEQFKREYSGDFNINCPRGIDNVRLPIINTNVETITGRRQ